MEPTLFPTTVIGSLPRPAWVLDLILDRKAGRISEEESEPLLDRAIESSIALQEQARLEEITDGEWRRESYVKVFAERVRGFKADLHDSGMPYPAVVAPIEYHRPLVLHELRFLRARTRRRVKITLPAPYIIGRRMWHADHSRKAYPTREGLMEACVPILRREIEALREAGADTVQLDEPWLSTMVDPAFRRREGIDDPSYEMDRCVDLVNQVLDGFRGLATGMHLCHAHFDRQHGSEGPYELIMPALQRVRVGTISMEYATPVAGGLDSLAQFPEKVRLGLGCIDHCEPRVESVEEVVKRVEEAMRHLDKSRITLHPDCGFAPSAQNPMDLDEAYRKLKAMCRAARLLREKHG
ncbi:MAG: cobalamin-independent methionine synthase II family protein [Acidobacteriota bacterium]|nr:cobalamin-independent methionine synthase II family protein [Acidobacteriota bacterium]